MMETHQKHFIFNLAHIKCQFLHVPPDAFWLCAHLSFVFSAIFCHSHNETSFSKPDSNTTRGENVISTLPKCNSLKELPAFFPKLPTHTAAAALLSTFCLVTLNQTGREAAV